MNDVVGRLCAAEDAPKVGDVFRAALALTVAVVLMGCDAPAVERNPWWIGTHYVTPWTDPETGCVYLAAPRNYGLTLTPRLDATGKPMCGAP